VSYWLTTPDGAVVSLNDAQSSPITLLEERFDGLVLLADTTLLYPGVWALSLQAYGEPERRAVLFFRVTTAPREIAISLILNPLARVSMAGAWSLGDLGEQE
jgi:hypothetical protein